MKIKNRKSFVQIGTHVYKDNHWHKKEPKKIHQYIMFKVCILKRKEKKRKYKRKFHFV